MYLALLLRLSGHFFFLLSALARLLHTKYKNNIIIGALGNIWDHHFYMGLQNSMSMESRIFYSHLRLGDIKENVILMTTYLVHCSVMVRPSLQVQEIPSSSPGGHLDNFFSFFF